MMKRQHKQERKQEKKHTPESKEEKAHVIKKLPNKLKLTAFSRKDALKAPGEPETKEEARKFDKENIDNLAEHTAEFMDQIQDEVESMYDLSEVGYTPDAKADGPAILYLGNHTNTPFMLKIIGIGNSFFETLELQRGDERTLHLEPGAYQIEYAYTNSYIKKRSNIAAGEDWLYKRRVDGTNVVQSLVEFFPGSYYLRAGGTMTAKEFKELLKELGNSPRH